MSVYGSAVRESCWYESIEECFYELAYNKISVHLVYVDLLLLKSVSLEKGICVCIKFALGNDSNCPFLQLK